MHRDFKLANLLMHNGSIKIADFGFSKILDTDAKANTMLGSPLNMVIYINFYIHFWNNKDLYLKLILKIMNILRIININI